jgi:YNFM family putative membrane transporter
VTLERHPDITSEQLAAPPPLLPDHLAFHEPGRPGYGRLVVGLFAAGVATFAALYSTQPLLGVLSHRFAVTPAHAAWSVSLTTLLLGLGMLAAGPLSGRWGRTRTIRWSLFATAALGVVCALAPTWPVLLLARSAQGLALAGVPAVALVYLREEVHPDVHPRATGLYIGGTALGGMTGRLLAGGVSDLAGWRWALGAVAILSAVCALIATLCLPAPRYVQRHQYTHGTAARAPAAGSTRRQSLHTTLRVLRDRELLGLYLISAAMMGAFVAVYNVLGLRLTTGPYHLSVFGASLVFCVYPLGSLGSALAGRLAERAGRPKVVLAGCLITLAGVALTLAAPLPLVIAGTGVITFGFFAAHGVASGWAATTGQRRYGAASQASALYLLAYYLGSSIFGELGTSLWTTGAWPAVATMSAALILLAAASAARPVLTHSH